MIFKPEGFIDGEYYSTSPEAATQLAKQANKILQAHLATLPRVYGKAESGYFGPAQHQVNTHTALLWGITEIEKKECEHQPDIGKLEEQNLCGLLIIIPVHKCTHCGVKLKAKWEPAC